MGRTNRKTDRETDRETPAPNTMYNPDRLSQKRTEIYDDDDCMQHHITSHSQRPKHRNPTKAKTIQLPIQIVTGMQEEYLCCYLPINEVPLTVSLVGN